jgi:hypothetical protein
LAQFETQLAKLEQDLTASKALKSAALAILDWIDDANKLVNDLGVKPSSLKPQTLLRRKQQPDSDDESDDED